MAKTFIGRMGAKNLLRTIFLLWVFIGLVAIISIILIVRYAVNSSESKNYAKNLQEEVAIFKVEDEKSMYIGGSKSDELSVNDGTDEKKVDIPESIDFAKLKGISEDAKAWLFQPGGGINYSVAQGKDNEFYLNHLLDGSENTAGNLFIDYRNEEPFYDDLTIIYGHNMKNGTMFGMLNHYAKQSYYDENPVMYLYTPEGRRELVILGGMKVEPDDDVYSMIDGRDEQNALVRKIMENSTFNASKESAQGADDRGDLLRLVMLSTCNGRNSFKRYVLLTYIK